MMLNELIVVKLEIIKICTIIAVISLALNIKAQAVYQDSIVEFDKDNYVVFHDDNRVEKINEFGGKSIEFGIAIRFIATVDGKTTTVGPFTTDPTKMNLDCSSNVKIVQYLDKHRIWIVSSLGRRLDGAVLLNLETGQFINSFEGNNFTLSPSRKYIAYSYEGMVFINDTLVYPEIETNINFESAQGPRRIGGEFLGKYISENAKSRDSLSSLASWDEHDALNFVVKNDKQQSMYSLLTLTPGAQFLEDLKIQKLAVSESQVKDIRKTINDVLNSNDNHQGSYFRLNVDSMETTVVTKLSLN